MNGNQEAVWWPGWPLLVPFKPGGCHEHSYGRLSFHSLAVAMGLYHLIYQSQALVPLLLSKLGPDGVAGE